MRVPFEMSFSFPESLCSGNGTDTDYLYICVLGQEIVQAGGLDDILSELNAQVRNPNQLTTLANMGKIDVLRSDKLIHSYLDLL